MHDVQNGLPTSVRYVKNGRSGRWWKSAHVNGQIHAGWKSIPDELLRDKDLPAIEKLLKAQYGDKQGARQDYNQLRYLLDSPSQHVWITFEDDFMWWCTVRDGVTTNPDGETAVSGHFWLTCARPWSKHFAHGETTCNIRTTGNGDNDGGVSGDRLHAQGFGGDTTAHYGRDGQGRD
jgi:hypothetical protein